MKKFFLLGICLITSVVFAQGLFPELEGFGTETGVASKAQKKQEKKMEEELPKIMPESGEVLAESAIAAEVSEEAIPEKEEEDLFAETVVPKEEVKVEDAPVEEKEEDEEEESTNQIQIYSDNIDTTITPNRNFSYCFGSIKFYNGLRREIQNLSVTLTYAGLKTDYNIRNLAPRATQEENITLLGTACEMIMDMPEMNIQKCQVPEMEEAACKKRVVFIPMR